MALLIFPHRFWPFDKTRRIEKIWNFRHAIIFFMLASIRRVAWSNPQVAENNRGSLSKGLAGWTYPNDVRLRCHVVRRSTVCERGASNILSVARIVYGAYTALEPTSVTPTRQIGWNKLISFTGDLDDPRCWRDAIWHPPHSQRRAETRYKWILQRVSGIVAQ